LWTFVKYLSRNIISGLPILYAELNDIILLVLLQFSFWYFQINISYPPSKIPNIYLMVFFNVDLSSPAFLLWMEDKLAIPYQFLNNIDNKIIKNNYVFLSLLLLFSPLSVWVITIELISHYDRSPKQVMYVYVLHLNQMFQIYTQRLSLTYVIVCIFQAIDIAGLCL
jgi:hypothetical protein